ncbi:MAG: polysaccharide biosynthesis C-terminal domain-containing protein [Bacteroidia bacterium]
MTTGQSFFNLGLRGLSLGARFLLIFYLGKYFSIEELGSYGIFFTTVTLAIFLLGLDFYNFSNREVLLVREEDRLSLLRDQLVFYAAVYVVCLPLLLFIFFYNVLPLSYIVFFYVILILEHLSQEFYRLFTMLSFPVFANWLLFFRSGIWVYVLMMVWWIMPPKEHSLTDVWWGWIVGAGISVILGFVKIGILYKKYILKPIDFNWIKSGIKVSIYYLAATIALKIIEFSNRYMIEYWCSIKAVGIYTFYNQMANMINVVIFTLFIMVMYPKFITAVNQNNRLNLKHIKTSLMKKVVISSCLLGLILVVIIKPILYLINKDDFYNEIDTFYVLILSNMVLNISFVYHYMLYALKKDMTILVSTLIGAVASIILNAVLINWMGILGAAIAILISYIIISFIKAFYARKSELDFEKAST